MKTVFAVTVVMFMLITGWVVGVMFAYRAGMTDFIHSSWFLAIPVVIIVGCFTMMHRLISQGELSSFSPFVYPSGTICYGRGFVFYKRIPGLAGGIRWFQYCYWQEEAKFIINHDNQGELRPAVIMIATKFITKGTFNGVQGNVPVERIFYGPTPCT